MCIVIFKVVKEARDLYLVGIYSVVEVTRLMRGSPIFPGKMTMIAAFLLRISNSLKNRNNVLRTFLRKLKKVRMFTEKRDI